MPLKKKKKKKAYFLELSNSTDSITAPWMSQETVKRERRGEGMNSHGHRTGA